MINVFTAIEVTSKFTYVIPEVAEIVNTRLIALTVWKTIKNISMLTKRCKKLSN
jgi:hypothetical protein